MDTFDTPLTPSQHEFGSSGIRCSTVGWGTGSSRMSDLEQSNSAVDDGPEIRDSENPESETILKHESAAFRKAIISGVNVFELGCITAQPKATLRRLAALTSALSETRTMAIEQGGTASVETNAPPTLVLFRFSFRQIPPSPVDLEYRLQAQSVQQVLQWVDARLQRWCGELKQQWNSLDQQLRKQLKLVWVWDDIDFREETSEPLRNAILQLVSRLRSLLQQRCSTEILLQGVGGFRWQSLAETVSRFEFETVLLHGFGILGPDLVGGLSTVCQRKGVALITSLPCYGGLLSHPLSLGPNHPTDDTQRRAAETARVVAEEHGLNLQQLAWSFVNQTDGVDCSLIEMPTPDYVSLVAESVSLNPSARIEALVTRHLRQIQRDRWFC